MAGIGFELRKLFVGKSAISKIRAYAYTSIITSGTMVLAVLMMLGIKYLAQYFGATEHQTDILLVMVVYATIGSLILSSVLQTILARYTADSLFEKNYERVLPSLFGGAILILIPGGLIYGIFLHFAPEIPVTDRLFNWGLFIEMTFVWLEMAYITAAKDYQRILLGFLAGVLTVFIVGGILLLSGIDPVTAVIAGLFAGYGLMIYSFTKILLQIFPVGSGSLFAFIKYFGLYPDLVFIGILGQMGAFVHIVLMWFSPLGENVTGLFCQAPMHDAAAFFAFLVTIPANVNFIVSVEVTFFKKYQHYFAAISNGGTLKEIQISQKNMTASLNQEVFRLIEIQVFAMVFYAILMRFFLESIGFTKDMITMFQIMCIGYSAYAIGNCVMQLQLYFNDRKGALLTCFLYFCTNLLCTRFFLFRSPIYYGLGMMIAGIVMYLAGIPRLFAFVRNIDYHIYCSQPILAVQRSNLWIKLASVLDEMEYGADRAYYRKTRNRNP